MRRSSPPPRRPWQPGRLPAVLLGLLLAGPLAPGWAAAAAAEEVEAELTALRARIAEIQTGLEALEGERDSNAARLQATELAIGDTVAAIRGLDADITAENGMLAGLEEAHRAAETELTESREALAAQLRAAYRLGRPDTLRLLLSQDDPAVVGRVLGYYRYYSAARVRQIATVTAQLDRLARLEERIQARAARLEELRVEQETDRRRLETSRALRATILEDLRSRMASQSARLAGLEADRQRLETLFTALQQALTDAEGGLALPDFASLAGQLEAPVPGRLLRGFGDGQGDSPSQGWFIAAERGDPIRAVSAGQVVFADWLRGFGLILILDHGQDWLSLYAHADSLFRNVGDWVRAGDVLGSVGASGGRGSPGLYFELRRDGKPVDPARWVHLAGR